VWSKSSYLFALFNNYHGYSVEEIGYLYVIDAVSALISGPLTGNLADIYGRRLFCQLYTVLLAANLIMRLSGWRVLVYSAQVLTGICSGLIMTAFESWLNYESKKDFDVK
jgi:MFS family permease